MRDDCPGGDDLTAHELEGPEAPSDGFRLGPTAAGDSGPPRTTGWAGGTGVGDFETVDSDPGGDPNATQATPVGGSGVGTPTPGGSDPGVAAGTVIGGRYRLVRPVGEGGMGTVWLARQSEPVRREVAVKLVKEGMDSRQVVARFEAERQALALMDHPNIARVFDAGVCAGRPFFVMELVPGVPITKYCDDRRLTPRERLELFIPVCRAIQHAHQKGVIHRDIKPSNVLVADYGGRPVPKVIDFGIAKAVGTPLTEGTMLTAQGIVVGTPEYMAPEQAGLDGLDVDTRCDVYALGVVLYELLTGSTPLDRAQLRRAGMLEILRLVREAEPQRPSTRLGGSGTISELAARRRTEPRRLPALVRGELDWITMRALEKDRDRRYETANALARDVERYLADEPVEASPPSVSYRLRKLARRHRVALATASAFALLLVGATALSAALAVRASNAEDAERNQRVRAQANAERASAAEHAERDQRVRAEANFATARAAVDKFTLFGDDRLLNQPHLEPVRREMLTTAREFYQKFAMDRRDDPAVAEDLARSYYNLGKINGEIGRADEAVAQLDKAAVLFDALAGGGDSPEARDRRARRARCDYAAGDILVRSRDAFAQVRGRLERALRLQRELAGDRPTAEQLNDLSLTLDRLARLANRANDPAAAADFSREGLACCDAWSRLEPGADKVDYRRSGLLNYLGQSEMGRGDLGPAGDHFRRSAAIMEGLHARHPEDASYAVDLFALTGNLGYLAQNVEPVDLNRAIALNERCKALIDRLAELYPSVIEHTERQAQSYINLGNTYREVGRDDRAEPLYREAREKLLAREREDPKRPSVRDLLAWDDHSLGSLAEDRGDHAAALAAYAESARRYGDLAREVPDRPFYRLEGAVGLQHAGRAATRLGRSAEAVGRLRQAVGVFGDQAGSKPDDPDTLMKLGEALALLGRAEARRGDAPAAREVYGRAARAVGPILDGPLRSKAEVPAVAQAYSTRAEALEALGRPAEALADWDAALAGEAPGPKPLGSQLRRARVLARAGRAAEAVAAVDAALAGRAPSPEQLVLGARALAAAATAAGPPRADALVGRALDLMARARRLAPTPTAADLDEEPELHALAGRPGFAALRLDAAFPADPFAP